MADDTKDRLVFTALQLFSEKGYESTSIADILKAIGRGRMLLAYSGGLHHVQIPGQLLPRPFKTIRVRLESVDIEAYRQSLREMPGSEEFKRAVRVDLERRRDLYCGSEMP